MSIVFGMSNAEYHRHPALGSTGLKRLAKSPKHFIAGGGEPTATMALGTLAHCVILEPHALASRYVVRPEGIDLRTKAGKEWAASIPAGVEHITADQLAAARAQRDSVMALPEVAALFESATAEVSAFWTDPATGAACKCRPDLVSDAGDGVILLDVKTAADASLGGFARAVVNYGYDLSCAWYTDGYAIASGKPVLGFVFAAVETEPPYAAAPYMVPDDWVEHARDRCARLARLHQECQAAGAWPAYDNSIQLLTMPAWAR